jgi:type I restriction enzyme R subunit
MRLIVERFLPDPRHPPRGRGVRADRDRKALLVMATGAGQDADRHRPDRPADAGQLVRRVLFPRRPVALVKQAHNAFKRICPASPVANLLKPRSERTITRRRGCFVDLPDDDGADRRDGRTASAAFGPGHFDLIVIDEAHRSVYRKYRAIFDYFDSPAGRPDGHAGDEIDRDTYSCSSSSAAFRPTPMTSRRPSGRLPRAAQGGLGAAEVPARGDPLRRALGRGQRGMGRAGMGTTTASRARTGRGRGDINKWLFNIDTVDKVLAHLMTHGLKVAGGDRLGKTIIFAKTRRMPTSSRKVRRQLSALAG